MPDQERDRLYRDAVESYRKAQEVFDKDPRPGTPEWRQWQLLVITAEHATAKYLKHVEDQTPPDRP